MKAGVSASPPLAPPVGLLATTVPWDGEELLVFSWPLRELALPGALTEAEREVLRGLLAGESGEDLARVRGTSARTVANQVASIFRKLGVSSRAELLARLHESARRAG